MKLVFNTLAYLFGGILALAGAAVLLLGLWLADQEYFDTLNTGVYLHTFTVNGRIVPMWSVILASIVAGLVLIAMSVLSFRLGVASGSHNTQG